MQNPAKPLVLGDFELATLEYLWTHESGNAKGIHAVLGQARNNSLNTVQSTLDRLFRKGLLERTKVGHSFQYRALFTRSEVLARKIGDLAAELAGGETDSLFAAFIEFTSRLDDSKMGELESLIAEHRKKSAEGGRHG